MAAEGRRLTARRRTSGSATIQRPLNLALPGPCSMKESTPMRASSVRNDLDEQLLLQLEAGGEGGVEAVVDRPLGERRGRRPRPRASSAAHSTAASRGDPSTTRSTSPIREGLLGAHLPSRQDDVLRPRRADEAGEPLRAAAAGDDPEQHLGLTEPGRRRRAPRKSQARASSQPPPSGDARRRRRSSPAGWRRRRRGRRRKAWPTTAASVGPAELADVGAGREHPLRAGHDDGAREDRRSGRGPPPSARAGAPSTGR